jgi:hypothetical protein
MDKTIHTSRTIMFSELSKVMNYGISQGTFADSFTDNVAGKLSKSNQAKTSRYLKQLYGFDMTDPFFSSFTWFWRNAAEQEHSIIAHLYAIRSDYLLSESIEVVQTIPLGNKASIDLFVNNLEKYHPNRFTPATLLSVAQNIASSWKQAGFIVGKMKNIRTQPEIGFWSVTYALLLGYLEGLRGEFLLGSKYVRTLGLMSQKVRDLVTEAAKRDLIQYQYAGQVTTIMFGSLLKQLGINGQ